MCGRYASHVREMHNWAKLIFDWPQDAVYGYNICPTQKIAAFTPAGGVAMRWGLVPGWSNEINPKYATFNAKIETLPEKPAFRGAWRSGQRCLIPALGYYEWRTENGAKQPYFVRARDDDGLVFAGLYEPARGDQFPASCTIITRSASDQLATLHSRMPLILPADLGENWLSVSPAEAEEMAREAVEPVVDIYAVSRAVNNPRNQGEHLIEPTHERLH